jgi:DNA polymerase-3 subunit epsilon
MKDELTTTCRICGKDTPMLGTRLCDRCWELETRIGLNPELAKTILTNLSNQPAGEMKLAKKDAIRTAREILALVPVYLDTETTGLGSDAQVIDIALIDTDGTELINTLVRPTEFVQ